MLSTNEDVNFFPQPTNFSFNPSQHNITELETTDLLFHHHNPFILPLFPPNSTVPNIASSSYPMMSSKQEIGDLSYRDNLQRKPPTIILPKKKPLKKDRNSKICTAQGLRDRRVRLSKEVARRFFLLKDMLGFDTASETLDWLLNKSRKAIRQLDQNGSASSGCIRCSSSIITTSEVVFKDGETNEDILKRKKMQLVKESRAKARARARERTRVKMSAKGNCSLHYFKNQLNTMSQNQQDGGGLFDSHHDHLLDVIAANNEIEEPRSHSSLASTELPEKNILEEPIVVNRKQNPFQVMGYHQNLLDLKCSSGNHRSSNFDFHLSNLTPNWDVNGLITHSGVCSLMNN